jgi:hypothetical protein
MPPRLTVIAWRDIPAQIVAKDGRRSAKHVLGLRFQVAIDRAATRAGKKDMDDYLDEWRRTDRPCGQDLDAEVAAEAARIEARFTKEHLAAVVAALGFEADVPGTGHAPAAAEAAPDASEDAWPAP